MRRLLSYLGVWCLLPERLLQGVVFLLQDAWFLLVRRRSIRRRIAALIEAHGACTRVDRGD